MFSIFGPQQYGQFSPQRHGGFGNGRLGFPKAPTTEGKYAAGNRQVTDPGGGGVGPVSTPAPVSPILAGTGKYAGLGVGGPKDPSGWGGIQAAPILNNGGPKYADLQPGSGGKNPGSWADQQGPVSGDPGSMGAEGFGEGLMSQLTSLFGGQSYQNTGLGGYGPSASDSYLNQFQVGFNPFSMNRG